MQAQAVVHDEPDGNILSRGEGAPSPALTRHKQPGVSDQAQATNNFC